MEYKDTLLMPDTQFEMRGNLTQKEPQFQARWEKNRLYDEMVKAREGKIPFVLHDGPPYANGNIHIGHALNKILKDIVVKSRFMMGNQVTFIPGWDTHGLPIETAITKQGHNRKAMSTAQFRALCDDFARKQIQTQMADMKALGTIGDYDHYYATLQPEFEAAQVTVFAKMAMDGMIYKGLKPVYWSPSSESALAEAEIEYHDKKDDTIFVAFDVTDGKGVLDKGDKFVIWTTTPWTIPANLAICLNPNLKYDLVDTSKGKLVVGHDLVESLMTKFELAPYTVLKTFKGSQLERIETKHPFYDRVSLVILGNHVTEEDGTGCVHTAPGHGVDDFNVGMKYDLPAFCPVDDRGCMTEEAGDFLVGQFVDKANVTVIEKLSELGCLLAKESIVHPYPHDWRTKKPVIYRATTQWFASIEKIRSTLLSEIDQVNWVNDWGKLRMNNMIKDRGDWCISRQRVWGLPIPIFYAEDDSVIMDQKVFDHVSDLFRAHGSSIWFEKDAKDLLPGGFTHPGSPNNLFRKETDIMDVWFDSGSSHTGVIKQRGGVLPVDLYLEGSDQYRGWFNSSLIISTAVYGHAPYKSVVSHGFVLDGKGEKMSKSLGNTVEPNKVVSQSGADILRLWTASIDYQSDVRISDDLLKQVTENYRKIRNTFRFMLANLKDFSQKDVLPLNELPEVDAYVLSKVYEVATEAVTSYEKYDYKSVITSVSNLMTNELSAYYLDFTKDILYCDGKSSKSRLAVQSVLFESVHVLTRVLAPVLVHTCEEIWDHFKADSVSVHLQDFSMKSFKVDQAETWVELLQFRSEVFKQLELSRADKVIGKSLEAKVEITVNETLKAKLNHSVPNLAQWLIVSEVDLKAGDQTSIIVTPATGMSCPRCWNVTHVHSEDGLCPRCQAVVKAL
ncbi:MAG: isoleucine--tRNA ligase [Erysipelotrichaceae bacterium]|nr:isoleucine--tRNA ligase [Erysipelotrichaceae bacterium]